MIGLHAHPVLIRRAVSHPTSLCSMRPCLSAGNEDQHQLAASSCDRDPSGCLSRLRRPWNVQSAGIFLPDLAVSATRT
jgi:hypothetical protein